MTLSTLTTLLYSWKLGVALFSSHIFIFLLQKIFMTQCSSKMMSKLLHWFLIGVQIISRPQLFLTSLAGSLFFIFLHLFSL